MKTTGTVITFKAPMRIVVEDLAFNERTVLVDTVENLPYRVTEGFDTLGEYLRHLADLLDEMEGKACSM